MVFTYKISGTPVLEKISIPLSPGKSILLTGVEDRSFLLIGGIIAGLFPIDAVDALPQVEELMKDFTGELDVQEGTFPSNPVYLGPDPEKHLLFSRVDEEIIAQAGESMGPESVLTIFGLGRQFVRRRISTLSGGEKMKLALAIAFAGAFDLIVLHGILPWLDGAGREILRREVRRAANEGTGILLLDQGVEELEAVVDRVLFFDGSKVVPNKKTYRVSAVEKVRLFAQGIAMRALKGRDSQETVRFDSVRFHYGSKEETDFFLEGISFVLSSGRVYGLLGDNGSGKSTIAKLMLRAEKAVQGSIRFQGRDISTLSRNELIKKICYVSQFPEQQIILSSVEEYKERAGRLRNELAGRLLDTYFRGRGPLPIAILSPLEMKVLLLSSSVNTGTRLIILDEPTWGIDLDGQARVLEVLVDIMDEIGDVTVLVISHDLRFLINLKAELFIVQNGSLRVQTHEE